ncbi:hypothetical protein M9458_024656, partial [Cirrhinus mrigala]
SPPGIRWEGDYDEKSSSLLPTRTQQLLCNTAVTNSKLEATEKGISPSDSDT